MPVFKQTNLSGGILRPELWGRTDLPKYPTYAARLENVYPTPTGQLVNRPGFQYVGQTKGNVLARLIPMSFSTGQSYVIELTPGWFRVIRDGVYINITTGPTDCIATTYTEDDIPDIKYAQIGDEIWLTCPGVKPRAIVRASENDWDIADILFTRNMTAPTGLGYDSGFTPVTLSDELGHYARKWEWVVTAWNIDKTDESPPSSAFTANSVCVYEDMPVDLKWNSVSMAGMYSVYRGRNGQYGFIGSTANTTFHDDGQVPLLSDDPPINRDPFIATGSGGNGYPRVVTFHQGRSVLGNLELLPHTIYLSQSGIFVNFDYALVPRDTDAIDLEIASSRYSEIRNMVSFKDSLVLMTANAEIVVQGASGDPLDATSIPNQRIQSYWGSSRLDPIIIGNSILWQLDGGYPFRDFYYDATKEMWVGRDLTLSAGLTSEYPLTSWGFARNPHRVVWGCSSGDGLIYSMTYDQDTDVVAWARHALDGGESGGRVVSLTTIPEFVGNTPVDTVYAVVAYDNLNTNPVTTYTVQRMLPRRDSNPISSDHIYLDCATTYSGVAENQGRSLLLTRTSGSGDYNVGNVFTVTANGSVFAADDVGDWIVLYPYELERRIKLQIDSYTSATEVSCTLMGGDLGAIDATTKGLYRFVTGGYDDAFDWGFARWVFTTDMYDTLFDGQTDVPLVVRADDRWQFMSTPLHALYAGEDNETMPGADTINEPAVFAVFGVAYRQVVETLDLATGAQSQSDLTLNQKLVKKAGFELSKSWGTFMVGQEEDDRYLTTWTAQRDTRQTVSYPYESHTYSGLGYMVPLANWDKGARIVLVSDNPFPFGISAIIREVEFGGT